MWKSSNSLSVTVANTNDIREEITRRTNMGNAYYYYSLEKNFIVPLTFQKIES